MIAQADTAAAIEALQQKMQLLLEQTHRFHPPLWESLLNVAIYALAGVLVAVAGYKIFDWCTPGDLSKEIIENRNVAAGIVGAAIIVGVCILVAASIMG
jgi:uncharacterized membrane protein YjfL (UPF0719 family)